MSAGYRDCKAKAHRQGRRKTITTERIGRGSVAPSEIVAERLAVARTFRKAPAMRKTWNHISNIVLLEHMTRYDGNNFAILLMVLFRFCATMRNQKNTRTPTKTFVALYNSFLSAYREHALHCITFSERLASTYVALHNFFWAHNERIRCAA